MSYETPTLSELRTRTLDDMFAQLVAAPASVRHSLLSVLATTHAGSAHELYGALEYYSKQLFPNSATGEYLDNCLLWRGIPRLPAQTAGGFVVCTGANGATIPEGLRLQSSTGLEYLTTASTTINELNAVVPVKAVDRGIQYNQPADTKLNLTSTLLGVEPKAVVQHISGGTMEETDDAYRFRALERINEPNIYGKQGDWVLWARDATPEILQGWEFPNYDNRGTLLIVAMNGTASSVSQGGISTAISYMQSVAPIGVLWDVKTATPTPDEYRLSIIPDTTANRQLGVDAITKWYAENAKPAMSINPILIRNLLISIPSIETAVVDAPTTTIAHGLLEYPVLGTITWGVL